LGFFLSRIAVSEVVIMSRAEKLYNLQTIDLKIAEKRRRLQEVEASLGESEELRRARQDLQESEEELSRWRTKLRDLELETDGLADKIAEVEEVLYSGSIRNPKELTSLQKEVQYLKRRKGELDEEVLEAMIKVEEGEKKVAEERGRLARVQAEWKSSQEELLVEQSELTAALSRLEEESAKLRKGVEEEDLHLYEELSHRKCGRGVALLRGEICQSCWVTLPTSVAQKARRRDVLTFCPSCERILYAELD
jgi:hypothetical protein